MAEHKIRRLPVLDRQDNLVGVVSVGDLATKVGAARQVGEAMEEIADPTVRPRSV